MNSNITIFLAAIAVLTFDQLRGFGLHVEEKFHEAGDEERSIRGRGEAALTDKLTLAYKEGEEHGVDLDAALAEYKKRQPEIIDPATYKAHLEDVQGLNITDEEQAAQDEARKEAMEEDGAEAFPEVEEAEDGGLIEPTADFDEEALKSPPAASKGPEEKEEEDVIIWLKCHPVGLGATLNDIVINPGERFNGMSYLKISRLEARKLIAEKRGSLNTRVSMTPDARI